jgi:thioredoxin-related protein
MKKLAMVALLAMAACVAQAKDLAWMTDMAKAQEQAKADGKLVFIDFTGSDWCGWCKKLDKEVFSTPEFTEYAGKNLVLLEVDFPTKKAQTDAQKKANKELAEKYAVKGYPTIIVLNSTGKKIGELGYEPGGPKPYIESIEKLKKK